MKLNIYFITAFSLLLSLILPSCAESLDEKDVKLGGNETAYLNLELDLAGTRGFEDKTSFVEGDEVLLVLTTSDLSVKDRVHKATYINGKWKTEDPILLDSDYTFALHVYYPYDVVRKGLLILHPYGKVGSSVIQALPDQPDIMYGVTSDINASNPNAKVTMNHKMSRLSFKFENHKNESIELDKIKIRNYVSVREQGVVVHDEIGRIPWIRQSGKFIAGNWTDTRVQDDECGEIEIKESITIDANNENYLDILIVPVTSDFLADVTKYVYEQQILGNDVVDTGILIQMNVNGTPKEVKISYNEWEPGVRYVYPITLKKEEMSLNPPANLEKIYLGFDGDDGKPLYWANMNIGAKSVQDYGGLFGWGDPTGKMTSENDEDYPIHLDNIAGTEFDIATVNWGAGWRVPSESEGRKLVDNCTYEYQEIGGKYGILFTSKINGNSIFLPEAANRIGENVYDFPEDPYFNYHLSSQYHMSIETDHYWCQQISMSKHDATGDYMHVPWLSPTWVNWGCSIRAVYSEP